MELKIGDKIRELRRRDGVTQEQVAAALGVSGQAVSKWESRAGYPDMETIPALANYFGVSIDDLFGYDGTREKRIREICERADSLFHRRDENTKERLSMLRAAVDEFPASGELLARLGCALYDSGWKLGASAYTTSEDPYIRPDTEANRKNPYWKEAILIDERALTFPLSSPAYETTVTDLLILYWETGEEEKAASLVNRQQSVAVCRERLAAKNLTNSWKPLGDGILAFLESMTDLIIHAAASVSSIPENEAHSYSVLTAYAAFLETVIPDENTLGATRNLFDLHFWRTVFAIRTETDTDGAFPRSVECLAKTLACADRQNSLADTGVHCYTAPYLKETTFDTTDLYRYEDGAIFRSMMQSIGPRRTPELDAALSAIPRYADWLSTQEENP